MSKRRKQLSEDEVFEDKINRTFSEADVFGVKKVLSEIEVFGRDLAEKEKKLSEAEVFAVVLPDNPTRAELGQYVRQRLDAIEQMIIEVSRAKQVTYVFKVERDEDGYIEQVVATPQRPKYN